MSSLDARSLFAAAREDGPDAFERDAVFRKIALTTGALAGSAVGVAALSALPTPPALGAAALAAETATSAGSAASTAAATGGAFGMKLLAIGMALGAVSTAIGVLLAVALVTPETTQTTKQAAAAVTPATAMPGAKLARPEPRKRETVDDAKASAAAEADAKTRGDANAKTSADANAKTGADTSARTGAEARGRTGAPSGGGDLAEEARLVTAARAALMAGDPARALSLVQTTRKLGSRSLEPEELGLEARALRALGRADDAAVTELVLRRRYPDHALAR
jgi:hypothetical protein